MPIRSGSNMPITFTAESNYELVEVQKALLLEVEAYLGVTQF